MAKGERQKRKPLQSTFNFDAQAKTIDKMCNADKGCE